MVKKILELRYQTVHSHCDKFESSRVCMEHTKSELQKQVKLQQQLLDVQVKQLHKMPTVAYAAVDNVIRSYSQISLQTKRQLWFYLKKN